MDESERKREARRQNALERLEANNPRCPCGEADPHCLERHHIAGRHFDDETVIMCRNCHRKLSDMQKDHPKGTGSQPDMLERVGHFLLGLADLFQLLVARLREFGEALIAQARANLEAERAKP